MAKIFLKVALKDELPHFIGLITLMLEVRPVMEDGRDIMVGDRKNEVANLCDYLCNFMTERSNETSDAILMQRTAQIFTRISESLRTGDGGDAITIIIERLLSDLVIPVYHQAALSLVRKAPTLENWKLFAKNMIDGK